MFSENQIDGKMLLELNDYMIAQLFSLINVQVRFHKSLNLLKNEIGIRSQQDLTSWMTEGMIMLVFIIEKHIICLLYSS